MIQAKAHKVYLKIKQEEFKKQRLEDQYKLARINTGRKNSLQKSIDLKRKDLLSKKKCEILLMKLENSVLLLILT